MRAISITRSRILRILVCITCVSINLATPRISAANVYSPSVVLSNYFAPVDPPPPNNQTGYQIRAREQPTDPGSPFGPGVSSVWVAIDANLVLSPYTQILDPGTIWYSVTNGTVLNPAFRSTATPFASNFNNTVGQIQLAVGQDFYLGFWIQDVTDRYGWAHLKLTSSTTLSLLGSAAEDSGSGIIVGTTTVVPEPSSFCLTALALVSALSCWRRRSV